MYIIIIIMINYYILLLWKDFKNIYFILVFISVLIFILSIFLYYTFCIYVKNFYKDRSIR